MKRFIRSDSFPIVLAALTFVFLAGFLAVFVLFLNLLPIKHKIIFHIRIQDVFVGILIYVKTAIDFAIFIGNLIRNNPGNKSRIAIQFGTAIGNGIGTCLILLVWSLFKEVPLLLVIMIGLASLVLLHLAEESLEELITKKPLALRRVHGLITTTKRFLRLVNKRSQVILHFIIPKSGALMNKSMPFTALLLFSMTIPFILGLDDFAGYIPLFSIVNVFGFSLGVFFAHMLLTILLFLSPKVTTRIVSNSATLLLGGFVFIGLALVGFFEMGQLLFSLF